MKKLDKVLLGLTSAATIGIIIYLARRQKEGRRLDQIAHEGYETAEDILFPLRTQRLKRV